MKKTYALNVFLYLDNFFFLASSVNASYPPHSYSLHQKTDPGSVARVGRGEAAEDCEMWADLESVWNSEVEAVPILQNSEPSINDSMSPVVSFISGDILTMFDRTTNRVKVAVEMKAV